MAVLATVKYEQYDFDLKVEKADARTIKKSKEIFKSYARRKIIVDCKFTDDVWIIDDQVAKCRISFQLPELKYERYARKLLGCTLREYIDSMKVLIIANLGADIKTLQVIATKCRSFLDVLSNLNKLKEIANQAHYLVDLLELLPGESLSRNTIIDELEDIAEYGSIKSNNSNPRNLATYQTYILFSDLLIDFWHGANKKDKTFYFPVYLWWNLTAILPLRPSEFVLIPRDCLKEKNGELFLVIRRTKHKGRKLSFEYSIEKDYEEYQYKIPSNMAVEIKQYINDTEVVYESDIYTLFSQNYQYKYLECTCEGKFSRHYTYALLSECLRHFFEKILKGRMGYFIREKETGIVDRVLGEMEIEKISLGDSRHIAMINLIISGGNPVICKELAGHEDITISANYYANIKSFIEVLSFYRYKNGTPNYATSTLPAICTEIDMPELKDGGRCASKAVKEGNYFDCMSAISLDGQLLDCESCRYYVRLRKKSKIELEKIICAEKEREINFHGDYKLLIDTIENVRKDFGYQDSIQSILLRLRADAGQYENVLYQKYKLEASEDE